MVQDDACGQLGEDGCCKCRRRADAGYGYDGHRNKKSAEAAAGQFPPGAVHDTPDGPLAGKEHHRSKKQGAYGEGDHGAFKGTDLLGQTPVYGGLNRNGDAAQEHQ